MLRWARLLMVATLAACAPHRTSRVSSDPNVITFEEIRAAHESTIYDVIAKLHGEYFRDRGTSSLAQSSHDVPVVFLNQQEYGAISTMRDIAARDIEEVHYIPWQDAVTRFGREYGGGVIQLISRVQ